MATSATYRLTDARKLFRGVAILALAISFSFASISGSVATNQTPAPLEFITVSSGETLWQLARHYAPGQDPRDWIAEVVTINALPSVELQPGQRIALPR
jgi:predicted Zn-dependent protease